MMKSLQSVITRTRVPIGRSPLYSCSFIFTLSNGHQEMGTRTAIISSFFFLIQKRRTMSLLQLRFCPACPHCTLSCICEAQCAILASSEINEWWVTSSQPGQSKHLIITQKKARYRWGIRGTPKRWCEAEYSPNLECMKAPNQILYYFWIMSHCIWFSWTNHHYCKSIAKCFHLMVLLVTALPAHIGT